MAQQERSLPPYLDPSLPIETRISDLLPRLTLEEKVIELSDSWGSRGIPRLKVPAMLKTEGLHGQSYSTGATIFPQAIMMASSWDTALVHGIGKVTAVESKAAGIRVSWSPVLDVARDVRWGRVEETYGEDPYLVSRMGVAWINGFQGQGMIAVVKHFAGHGEPLGGRDSHDVGLSDRTMRNVHLVPFRAAIREAHAGGVMAAYSTWDAVPNNASTELLQKILREEWGFDGIVVSDCGAPENLFKKQSVADDPDQAVRMAILAGVDIECGTLNAHTLAGAIQRGVLRESDLDANLRCVFRAKYRLGLFDGPAPDKMNWAKLPVYDIPPHRTLAREAAIEGSVLLKNPGHLLPLSKDIGSIAVIGPAADSLLTGDYSGKAASGQLVTVLQGIRRHVGAATKVLYAPGCGVLSMDSSGFGRAVDAASHADVVVLAVAGHSGENIDGATLEIPGVQRQLIRRIAATGKPVVLVLENGKPLTLNWESEHLAAILETWYPGEEGGDATADILFGDANPSGRLPVTFPRNAGQLPLRYDYLPSGRNYDYYDMPFTPLYRFGYGLSYTTFRYSNLKTAVDGDTVVVSADVENTGDRAGDEVAQLYVTDVVSSVITPVISLKGFQRVHLDKGEKKTVRFFLTPYQLSLLNASMERVVESGEFRVHVGGVSPAPPSGNTEHKRRIGFTDPREGVSGAFDLTKGYRAVFVPTVSMLSSSKVQVTVVNTGNLTDVADIKIYGDSLLGDHRSEIDAGDTVRHTFDVTGQQQITVIVGRKLITRQVGQRTEYAGVFAPGNMFVHEGEKPYRDDLCLNGLWQFEPVALPVGFKEGFDPAPALGAVDPGGWDKTPIRIPSPWNVNSFADRNGQGGDFRCYPSYPAAWDNCKMGWLRKTFVIPAGWKGRRMQLHFEAVAGDVEVLVNGKPVGRHFGIFLPWDIDITDAVRPGSENEVCVGVRKASLFDVRGSYGRRLYQAGSFWGQHIAGIWQDVFVVALPDVHVSRVFVQPRVDADTLAAEVSVVNDKDVDAAVTVDASAGGLRLAGGVVHIPAHGETRVLLSARVRGRLRFWSTETPNLYDLVVKVQDHGSIEDVRTTRFGWRQVSLRGTQVLLNGKPIVMRGDSWHFLGIPQMSRRYAEAWYRAMRDAGLNAVRLHAEPYPSFYLDVADSMGILVLDESAMWASDGGPKLDDPRYWQDSKRHLSELILRDRNHPSVFGWSVSNEIMPVVRNVFHNPPGMADTLLKYDSEWIGICRDLDPTRQWISADGEDDGGGRFPVYIVHYGGLDAMNRAEKSGKPWGVGEAGNAYYGTPEQVAQTNGDRAYESFLGRMEGVAASSYASLIAQRERNAIYQSVFNLVWYGLRPLPLGLRDTSRAPTLEDGVYFTHFQEGEPGVQPERLGPYCTTLNPGYDPRLPLYRTWPLFDAIHDAGLSREVLFADGPHAYGKIAAVTARGGTAVVWGLRPEWLAELNKVLPAPLELYPRKVSSLVTVGHDSITSGLSAAQLYFSEMRPPEIVDHTLGGPLVDGGRVVLAACNTDWLKWNKQPEYAKTAMVVRSELETKAPGAVLAVIPMGRGRLVVSTLPAAPRVDKEAFAVRKLLGNLGVSVGDSLGGAKPLQADGQLALNGAREFWVLSPRSLDDLLSEPNIPVVTLSVPGGEVWLNDEQVGRGRPLRLRQGWNHFVIRGNVVSGRFICNQPDFLKELDSSFGRP